MLTSEDLTLLNRLLEQEFERLAAVVWPPETPLHERQEHARELVRLANCATNLAALP